MLSGKCSVTKGATVSTSAYFLASWIIMAIQRFLVCFRGSQHFLLQPHSEDKNHWINQEIPYSWGCARKSSLNQWILLPQYFPCWINQLHTLQLTEEKEKSSVDGDFPGSFKKKLSECIGHRWETGPSPQAVKQPWANHGLYSLFHVGQLINPCMSMYGLLGCQIY